MPHAQIVVFTERQPTAVQSEIIRRLNGNGWAPLVDSVHFHRSWFMENFRNICHKAFYNEPILLEGEVAEIDFGIMGKPHFIVYYSEKVDPVPDQYAWECIVKYFDLILNDHDNIDDFEIEKAKEFLNPAQIVPLMTSTFLLQDQDENSNVAQLVVDRKMEDFYYTFEKKYIKEADLMICQVTKPFVERPFTIVIDKFSENGYSKLFTDLFASNDFGYTFTNMKFLESVWKELGLQKDGEEFDLEGRLKLRTEACVPNESLEIVGEPKVYRKSINEIGDLWGSKFLPQQI